MNFSSSRSVGSIGVSKIKLPMSRTSFASWLRKIAVSPTDHCSGLEISILIAPDRTSLRTVLKCVVLTLLGSDGTLFLNSGVFPWENKHNSHRILVQMCSAKNSWTNLSLVWFAGTTPLTLGCCFAHLAEVRSRNSCLFFPHDLLKTH